MKISIVLGAGFGDEGKGRTVSYLVSQSKKPLVIRFSGGHQAGHTVFVNNKQHIFSHFGSGTLQNAPTYWSKFCTTYPIGLVNEWTALKDQGINSSIFIDPLSPVTTPFDVYANRYVNANNQHGTCGAGFGTTIERQENHYKLQFIDLFYHSVLEAKLKNIEDYYKAKGWVFSNEPDFKNRMKCFFDSVDIINHYDIGNIQDFQFNDFDHVIFEGSQGLLLDKDIGFFPNVTRSNTTSENALALIDELFNTVEKDITTFFVTRCYQTRHGNGYMSDERFLDLKNIENETNILNSYQGKFRTGYLDLSLLRYAIYRETLNNPKGIKYCLVVTCIDQLLNSTFTVKDGGKLRVIGLNDFRLIISNVLFSYGRATDKIDIIAYTEGSKF
jgi:adenylosuccinate synthase